MKAQSQLRIAWAVPADRISVRTDRTVRRCEKTACVTRMRDRAAHPTDHATAPPRDRCTAGARGGGKGGPNCLRLQKRSDADQEKSLGTDCRRHGDRLKGSRPWFRRMRALRARAPVLNFLAARKALEHHVRAPRAKPSAVSERFVYVALFISNKTRLMASSASSPLLRHAFLEHILDD